MYAQRSLLIEKMMKNSFTIHDENENIVVNKKSGLSKGTSSNFVAQSNKIKVVKSERKALSNLSGSQINIRYENPIVKKTTLMKPTIFKNLCEPSENTNNKTRAEKTNFSTYGDIDTVCLHFLI